MEPANSTAPAPMTDAGASQDAITYPSSRIIRRSHSKWSLPPTAFNTQIPVEHGEQPRSTVIWFALGLIAGALGMLLSWLCFAPASSKVGALLFTCLPLVGFIFPLFQQHAHTVWSGGSPWRADWQLGRALGAMTIGCAAAGWLALRLIPSEYVSMSFPNRGTNDILNMLSLMGIFDTAGSWGRGMLYHGTLALVAILVGLILRYPGILLLLVMVGLSGGWMLADAAANAKSVLIAIYLAVLFTSLVIAAMAGIFAMRGLTGYRFLGETQARIMGAVIQLLAIAVLIAGIANTLFVFAIR